MELSWLILNTLVNTDWDFPEISQVYHFWIQLVIFSLNLFFFLNAHFGGFLIPQQRHNHHATSSPSILPKSNWSSIPVNDSFLLFIKTNIFFLHVNTTSHQISANYFIALAYPALSFKFILPIATKLILLKQKP